MPAVRRIAIILLALVAGGALGYLLKGGAAKHAPEAPWDDINRTVFAVSGILIPVDKDHPAASAMATATRVHEQLRDGADFAEVATRTSQDPSARDGGYMGILPLDSQSPVAIIAQALAPGQISFPVRVPEGYQIVLRHTLDEARALETKHQIPTYGVFITWDGVPGGQPGVTKEMARTRAEALVKGLKDGSLTLADAAQRIAEDAGTKGEGPRSTFLGVLSRRPTTEKAFAALSQVEPGAVVGPIEEPHGYAVLRRAPHFRSLVKHILVMHLRSRGRSINISRTRAQAREIAEKVLGEVRADPSTWDSAVERYSDDAKTLTNGGNLGVVHAGQLPQGLDKAILDVTPGGIHGKVLESVDGFHIVWRVN